MRNSKGQFIKGNISFNKGRKFSDGYKRKISEAHIGKKGRPVSQETRQKLSKVNKGRVLSEEWRRKIGNANKGKKRSDEIRKQISEKQKGKRLSEETKRKLSENNKGRKVSEETRRKIGLANSVALKGRKLSKEHIKKMMNRKASIETKKKLSELRKGEKHHNWQGGITPINAKIRNSFEVKLWKKVCLERDDFTCQKTGERGGDLVVHHINNFADFPELRTTISNGITLSEKAHREFHKKYGKRNNTKGQLEEFLKHYARR